MQNPRVPLFLELRNLNISLESLITERLKSFSKDFSFDDFVSIAKSGRVLLLLDGFDEINPELQSKTASEIDTLAQQLPALQIVVTTRPQTAIETCPQFEIYQLQGLPLSDHEFFLARITRDPKEAKRILDEVKSNSPQVLNLIKTPLLLTLLAVLYRGQTKIPATVHDFYQHLFHTLFYRHDRLKMAYERKRETDLTESEFRKLFEAFCFVSRTQNILSFDAQTFATCFEAALTAGEWKVKADHFRNDSVKSLCLLQEDGFRYYFIHRSVQEYYAASFIRTSGEAFARRWYETTATTSCTTYSQELNFLEQIDTARFAQFFWLPNFDHLLAAHGGGSEVTKKFAESLFGKFSVFLLPGVGSRDARVLFPQRVELRDARDATDFLSYLIVPLVSRYVPSMPIPISKLGEVASQLETGSSLLDMQSELRHRVAIGHSAARHEVMLPFSTYLRNALPPSRHEPMTDLFAAAMHNKRDALRKSVASEARKAVLFDLKPNALISADD